MSLDICVCVCVLVCVCKMQYGRFICKIEFASCNQKDAICKTLVRWSSSLLPKIEETVCTLLYTAFKSGSFSSSCFLIKPGNFISFNWVLGQAYYPVCQVIVFTAV